MLSTSQRSERDKLSIKQLQALIDRYEAEIRRIEREMREIQNRAQSRPEEVSYG